MEKAVHPAAVGALLAAHWECKASTLGGSGGVILWAKKRRYWRGSTTDPPLLLPTLQFFYPSPSFLESSYQPSLCSIEG